MDNDEQQNLTAQSTSEPPSDEAETAPREVADNSVEQGAEEAQAKPVRKKKKTKQKKKNKNAWLIWGISVFFLSFALTVLFSFLTEISVKGSPAYVCIIVLLVLLVLNISCDVLANAIISISPEAFHAMASNKIKGAKRAVYFCRNATKLSSIFADVIGDICGIVSGAAGAALVVNVAVTGGTMELVASIGISAAIGALTVGGKAIFKHFALKFNKQIVFGFAKFTTFFKKEK
ncbi:MAG: hypothetical protein K2K38_05190 [Clostridia bacterium]|nr:hypothetical protein [Clostridia bacterium]